MARPGADLAYCLRTLHMPLPRRPPGEKRLLRSLYNRVLALAADRRAAVYLGGVSFAESSFFPIPPDAMLIPMCLARPDRAWRYALICTVTSVLGGILGLCRRAGKGPRLVRTLGRCSNPDQGPYPDSIQNSDYCFWRSSF